QGERALRPACTDVVGHAALQAAGAVTEPAARADEYEPVDDVRMIGGELLRDAAAGRDAEDVDRTVVERPDRVGVLGGEGGHCHPSRKIGAAVAEHHTSTAHERRERGPGSPLRQLRLDTRPWEEARQV